MYKLLLCICHLPSKECLFSLNFKYVLLYVALLHEIKGYKYISKTLIITRDPISMHVQKSGLK